MKTSVLIEKVLAQVWESCNKQYEYSDFKLVLIALMFGIRCLCTSPRFLH